MSWTLKYFLMTCCLWWEGYYCLKCNGTQCILSIKTNACVRIGFVLHVPIISFPNSTKGGVTYEMIQIGEIFLEITLPVALCPILIPLYRKRCNVVELYFSVSPLGWSNILNIQIVIIKIRALDQLERASRTGRSKKWKAASPPDAGEWSKGRQTGWWISSHILTPRNKNFMLPVHNGQETGPLRCFSSKHAHTPISMRLFHAKTSKASTRTREIHRQAPTF
jgi:hypothetical protein